MNLKRLSHIVLCTTILAWSNVAFTQSFNEQVEANIIQRANAEFINVVGQAYNKTQINQVLQFQLSVHRSDSLGSNRTRNSQSGRILLSPGEKQNLSSTTISTNDSDRIIILLLVANSSGEILGKDRIIINPTEEDRIALAREEELRQKTVSKDAKFEQGDGILLKGIIVEDTKTKPGRDFFRYFQLDYNSKEINGEKIVTVKESLAIANNTKIEIMAGNTLVFQFILRPQDDFLRAASAQAIDYVERYFTFLRNSNVTERF